MIDELKSLVGRVLKTVLSELKYWKLLTKIEKNGNGTNVNGLVFDRVLVKYWIIDKMLQLEVNVLTVHVL